MINSIEDKSNKKVLIVCSLAGFLHFLTNDFNYYLSRGYSIDCVSNNYNNEPIVKSPKLKDVNFIDFPFNSSKPFSKNNIKSYHFIKKLLKKNNYSIVHCHTPIVSFYVRLAAKKYRKKGCKVIYTSHGLAFNCLSSTKSSLLYKIVEKTMSKKTDLIITINHEDYHAVKKMNCKNVGYIPGVGVDVEKFRDSVSNHHLRSNHLNRSNDKITIVSIGELSKRKNHISLLRAIADSKYKDKINVIILGKSVSDKSIQESLIEYAAQERINLVMPGHVSNVGEYLSLCDFTCLPSLREGLGLAGIESLASGKPVIGSNVQGIKDYVIDGQTGYLFNPYDVHDLTIALDKMIENKNSFSKTVCFDVSTRFSKDASFIAFSNLMDGFLGIEGKQND